MNLVWFRNDLRIDDNPALYHAMNDPDTGVVAVYCLCREQWQRHGMGPNQQALMLDALQRLGDALGSLNVPLVVLDVGVFDKTPRAIKRFCLQHQIEQVFFNVEYPWNERQRDRSLAEALDGNVKCQRFIGQSLVAPWEVVNGEKNGYKVYTAYARQARALIEREQRSPLPAPKAKPAANFHLIDLSEYDFDLPVIEPDADALPDIAFKTLSKQLDNFCGGPIERYSEDRNFPAVKGTSQLSAALAVGAISPLRCFQVAHQSGTPEAERWISQLIWRDFYRAIMWHYPHVSREKAFLNVETNIQWNHDQVLLQKWQNGETGVPIIDAAMKQLLTRGWMHNRLRMIVASYLSKNLWLDWRLGEAFFAHHLFDFDFANNNGGWQWSASVGTDAAPYFRVFNPMTQQHRFDPDARFIKQWLPQLKPFDAKSIHRCDSKALPGYPSPLVDLKSSRRLAIDLFKQAKSAA